MNTKIPENIVFKLQEHLHSLIRSRASFLIDKYDLKLPKLSPNYENYKDKTTWFSVSGMYGGFNYWYEYNGTNIKLIVVSWCRVVEGSGQRHEITKDGYKLVDKGFL